MKYVIRAAPILVALALFVSFLVVQQSKPVEAVVGTLLMGVNDFDTAGAGMDTAVSGSPSSGATFDRRNFANSQDPLRKIVLQYSDSDLAGSSTIALTKFESDSSGTTWKDPSTGCTTRMELDEIGATGVFQQTFYITDVALDENLQNCEDSTVTTQTLRPVMLAKDGDNVITEFLDGTTLRRFTMVIENTAPRITKLSPGHETIGDDDEIAVSVEVTDEESGVIESTIFFIKSDAQCAETDLFDTGVATFTVPVIFALGTDRGDVTTVDCDAGGSAGPLELIPPDSTDDIEVGGVDIGFSVETTVFLSLGAGPFGPNFQEVFIGVIAVDGAGNVGILDIDDDEATEILASYVVDDEEPDLIEARTGMLWDPDDEEFVANNRNWIQLIFRDNTDLVQSSIDDEDIEVEGHTVALVKWFDDDPVDLDDVGTVAGDSEEEIVRRMLFVKLTDDLDADEIPDVFLVPNGVSDEAGGNNSSDSVTADDFIGPKFVVSNFLPAPTSASLAGEDVEVTFTITSDEDLDGDEPDVTVYDVFDPGVDASVGTSISSSGTNRWSVVVDEVSGDTATIYNVHITGEDDENNEADLGIANEVAGVTQDLADPADLDDDGTTAEADGLLDAFFETITDTDQCPLPATSTTCVLFSNFGASGINEDAIYFEGDTGDLADPDTVPAEDGSSDIRSPFFISLDFGAEGSEFEEDDHGKVDLLSATLDGVDVLASASTADEAKWLIAILDIELGDHELVINASDQAGNELADGEFTLEFEVTERAPIEVALNPGWNLVSLPGQPADPSIDAVMANNDATAVITYDPTIPGGFLVAVRDPGGTFAGTLKTMDATRGYWVLTDSFQPIEVDVPPLAAGSAGVLPPTIPIAKGWNLVPVQDPTGVFKSGDKLQAKSYFTSATEVSAVYFFDTILNQWEFVDITDDSTTGTPPAFTGATVEIGRAYWVFSTEAGSLVPVPISADLS